MVLNQGFNGLCTIAICRIQNSVFVCMWDRDLVADSHFDLSHIDIHCCSDRIFGQFLKNWYTLSSFPMPLLMCVNSMDKWWCLWHVKNMSNHYFLLLFLCYYFFLFWENPMKKKRKFITHPLTYKLLISFKLTAGVCTQQKNIVYNLNIKHTCLGNFLCLAKQKKLGKKNKFHTSKKREYYWEKVKHSFIHEKKKFFNQLKRKKELNIQTFMRLMNLLSLAESSDSIWNIYEFLRSAYKKKLYILFRFGSLSY